MNPARPVLPSDQQPNTKLAELNIAEDQPQYSTLPALVFSSPEGPATLSRWEFTDEERERIARGESLFLEVLGAMVPVKLYVATAAEVCESISADADAVDMPTSVSNRLS